MRTQVICSLLMAAASLPALFAQNTSQTDVIMSAMRDEMARSTKQLSWGIWRSLTLLRIGWWIRRPTVYLPALVL